MGTPAEILIKVLIEKCNNDDIKKGLDTALNIVQEEGYLNLDDLEEMSEEELYEEALCYISYDRCEMK